jgi:hypothetical protein
MYALSPFVLLSVTFAMGYSSLANVASTLGVVAGVVSGAAFGLTVALVGVLTDKSKYVGVILGVLVHFVGVILLILSVSLSPGLTPFVFSFIGCGFMVGSLAGFAVVVERGAWRKTSRDRSPVLPGIPR